MTPPPKSVTPTSSTAAPALQRPTDAYRRGSRGVAGESWHRYVPGTSAYGSIRQHTSAYVNTCQHSDADSKVWQSSVVIYDIYLLHIYITYIYWQTSAGYTYIYVCVMYVCMYGTLESMFRFEVSRLPPQQIETIHLSIYLSIYRSISTYLHMYIHIGFLCGKNILCIFLMPVTRH